MERRKFIQQSTLIGAGVLISKNIFAQDNIFPKVRVPASERKFVSKAVEEAIDKVKKGSGNKETAWLFENCFANTLDTTVDFELINGKPDTYIITGDIDAMWLRDSSAQVWPYLTLIKADKHLQEMVKGVINRQVKCVLLDPYANAFYKDENKISEWKSDLTTMKPGIHERKWEVDSLCYPMRLAYGYWKQTGDVSPFDNTWKEAITLILKTFKAQQRINDEGPYTFQRTTAWATDGVPLAGYGYPAKKIGLIHSMFRPSDDATIFPFLIPSNIFAAITLQDLSVLFSTGLKDNALANECLNFSKKLFESIETYGTIEHKKFGKIYAYEVNGFGSYNLMDDANVPSLLSIPYLSSTFNKKVVENTRQFVLSNDNPFFFKGSAGEGIGGPHIGIDYIWPLSIIMRGLTSTNDAEISKCIVMLQKSNAGTGFMHESFYKNDAAKFTRKWFAWANTIYGEFILKVYNERPHLLK